MNSKLIKILLVDDDADDFFLTSSYLKELSNLQFEINWCPTFNDALKEIGKNKYDLYLFDYLLGENNGIDLIKKAGSFGCDGPIILLTGRGDSKIADEALRLGAADFLVKSELNAEKLERSIRYALERAQVLKALRLSERRYRRVFEESNDFLFIADMQGNILDCNSSASAITGYSIEELKSKNIHQLVSDEFFYTLWLDLASNSIRDEEVTLNGVTKDKKKYCLLSASKEKSEEQEYIQGRMHDMTSRKQMEREKLYVEKMAVTGRLVRMLAHEVRNPLTNVNLAAEQLEMELEDDDQKFYTQIIKRNCKRINDLITMLLQPSITIDINLKPGSVHAVLNDSIASAYDRVVLKRIKIETDFEIKENDILPIDTVSLQMAFSNLITNAIEAMHEDVGVLKIQTKYQKGIYQIIFSDNGSGISKENIEKVFEPYFTCKNNGMGIGLATTLNIIHAHHGKIDLHSELGVGTTFIISFEI